MFSWSRKRATALRRLVRRQFIVHVVRPSEWLKTGGRGWGLYWLISDAGQKVVIVGRNSVSVSITAAGSTVQCRAGVPTFKVQSKPHAAGNSHVSRIPQKIKIQISPSLAMISSGCLLRVSPRKTSWPKVLPLIYKRLSRLETDCSLI